MITTLTKNAIDNMVNNSNEPNEEYVIQVMVAPAFVADSLYKFTFSDGFARTKKGYLVSDAASRQDEIKELSILKVKKFINPEQSVDRERIIVATFELLYSNVTDLIGKPIEYKNYKNAGMQNPDGSIVIPEKYLNRSQANKNPTGAAGGGQNRQGPNAFQNYNNNNNNNNGYQNKQGGSSNPYGHNKVTQNPQSLFGQNQNQQQRQQGGNGGMPVSNQEDERDLERISSLSPHLEAAFKARVTKKGDTKNFKSAKGDGILFSIDVIDQHGSETTISFFNQEASKYFNYIQVEQVYIFKNGQIKVNPNKTFNKGEVVVTMTKDSQIMVGHDDGRIPFMVMNRKRIGEIQSQEKDKLIDIIGFIRENSESRVVTLKDQNQKQRRDIKVFDESRMEIEISLWGDNADRVNAREGDLIVIKDARVGEYKEKKQISAGYTTQFFLNPDFSKFPEALAVQQWRDANDLTQLISEFQSKSPQQSGGGGDAGMSVPTIQWESSIMQLREEINMARVNNMFSDEFRIWREVRALVHFVKDSMLYYDSCEKCKRKVKLDVDRWFCEQCQTSSEQPYSRYITTILIADSTDQIWVSAFDEVSKKIFGFSANEFRLIGDNNTEEKKKKLQQVHYKEFRFLLLTRSEKDPSTGQYRDKTTIHAIKEEQPAYESKRILNSLEKYLELE